MSRFKVKYKVREGDSYENLVQRFGPTILANAAASKGIKRGTNGL